MICQGARCHHPEQMAELQYAWPPGTVVSWYLDGSVLPAGFDYARAARAIADAFAQHAAAAAVECPPAPNMAAARVIVTFQFLDNSLVTLGLTDLPTGDPDQVVTLRLNAAVAWTDQELYQVALHEAGHALGAVHTDPAVVGPCVMAAYYNPALVTLQPPDVAQDQARYGPRPSPTGAAAPDPTASAPPTPAPEAPAGGAPASNPDGSVSIEVEIAAAGRYVITLAMKPETS